MDTQNPSLNSFYKDEKNARKYIESKDGMDGRFLIEILKKHLQTNSTVLELGMGSGKDLNILNEAFKATGSDYSQAFLDIYKQNNPNADLILLNATKLETKRKFDCIYSNKVLHHLSTQELKQSLKLQKQKLSSNGVLFHTFWYGFGRENFQGLHFIKYKLDEITELAKNEYDIIETKKYAEMNLNDSFYITLKAN